MAYSLRELRALSDDELIRQHDAVAPSTEVGVNYYLDELARRDLERQTAQMLRSTTQVEKMTQIILWASGVMAIASVVQAVVAIWTCCK